MLALVLAKLCTLKASSEVARFYCPSLSGVEGSAGSWQPPSAPAKLVGAAGLHCLASLPELCCVVRAGGCSPLQRAAQRTAAAAREHGQPAVPHRPFPPHKPTVTIWAPAAPPASYSGPRETLRVQGCAREVLRVREESEVSWNPWCSPLCIRERFGRALGQAENRHTCPANPT